MTPRLRDGLVAVCVASMLTVLLTWPLAAGLGSSGRLHTSDGRHGVWNVAWVARALTTAPSTVFDANIFHPHQYALAYSEANLVAGVLAVPAWLVTDGNPYAAYNSVVLIAFALAALCGYLLARTIGASRGGAAVGAVIYGYSPYMLAHIPHIQLLMTFGPALSLAMFHRFIDDPSTRRALLLGGALAVTGLSCAYYGLFSGLVVSVGVVWFAAVNGRWRHWQYWGRAALAGGVVFVAIAPFFVPYLSIREAGFERSLDEARLFSTTGRAYLASAVHVHRWILPWLDSWREVLFPGFQAVALAAAALAMSWRAPDAGRRRLTVWIVAMMALSFWISLGPDAGLYTMLYHTLPAFSFLRAPARMGVLVTLGAAMLASLAVTWWGLAGRRRSLVLTALLAVAIVESWAGPLALVPAPPISPVYTRLAALPPAAVVEVPFFHSSADRHRQTEYMLMSTFHWQPLLNGYSDHFPSDYFEAAQVLDGFPSRSSVDWLRARGIRWVVVHFERYSPARHPELRRRLGELGEGLRLAQDAGSQRLYEVVWPAAPAAGPSP